MDCLLSGMGSALARVRDLKLEVVYQNCRSQPLLSTDTVLFESVRDRKYPSRSARPPLPPMTTYLADLQPVMGAVFSKLAMCVSRVHTLDLVGYCDCAALQIFGLACPLLRTLYVEPLDVRMSVLGGLSDRLPNLRRLVLRNRHLGSTNRMQLAVYLDLLLRELSHCQHLRELVIDVPVSVRCAPASWDLLPPSLECLKCNTFTVLSPQHVALFRRLRCLHLAQLPCEDLMSLLESYPLLQELQLSTKIPLRMICPDMGSTSRTAMLSDRFLDGKFKLSCSRMMLEGSSRDIANTLRCLPQLSSVRCVNLKFTGEIDAGLQSLRLMPHVFPNMHSRTLENA